MSLWITGTQVDNEETLGNLPVLQKNETLINLKGVGVYRAGRWLVRGVDLSVRAGEIVTIIGPNGSGKTTTAKMAIGVTRPDEGQVVRARNLRIGYVPQKLSINAAMPLTVRGLLMLSGKQNSSDIDETLDMVGVLRLANAQVHFLSGGEFQRVLFARALLGKPQLLVLDEPVDGVDFSGSLELYQLISKIRDTTGCGVLLISHDLHVVMAQTDTVICLNSHVCCRGTPELVAENPEYLKLFGKGAAQDLAIYKHHHDHTHLADGTVVHTSVEHTDEGHEGCDHD